MFYFIQNRKNVFGNKKYLTSIIRWKNFSVGYRFNFPNGYGASVVRGKYSYGNELNLYELAVIYNDYIVYDTEITPNHDVIGHLTARDVEELLNKIKELKGDNV